MSTHGIGIGLADGRKQEQQQHGHQHRRVQPPQLDPLLVWQRNRYLLLTLLLGAFVTLFDPIFEGLAIALMFGALAL